MKNQTTKGKAKKQQRFKKGNAQLRCLLIREAAKVMYEEDVKQYFDAKRIAAKRLTGGTNRSRTSIRPQDLPSNGEIAAEVSQLVRFYEGTEIEQQLFEMRVLSLEVMEILHEFQPRLIGSVSKGNIRKGSDIDLHLFADHLEPITEQIHQQGWDYEHQEITINKNGRWLSFDHIYLDLAFPVELSVYPTSDLKVRTRSSTDGKPIIRLNNKRLLELILDQHPDAWEQSLLTQ